MNIEKFKRELQNYFSKLEEILDSSSYSKDKEKIINITQATNNILYGSAIGTFVLTMEGSTNILDEKDFEKLKPLFTANTNIHFIDNVICDAKGMIKIASKKFEEKNFVDLAYFEPNYGKEFYTTMKV